MEEGGYGDYNGFLGKLKQSAIDLQKLSELNKRDKLIKKISSSAIKFADKIAFSGDYFEAGELLFSASELLEEQDFPEVILLYTHIIELWEKLIEEYKGEAKLHEIAEMYLKIADLNGEKLQDFTSEKKAVLNSIELLMQEAELLKEFGETKKLSQNYQNIADLYARLSDYKNAIKFYDNVIALSKQFDYYDLLSFSYQQLATMYEEFDDYNKSKDVLLDGVEYFANLFHNFEEKNDNLLLAQICQILKNLYYALNNKEQFINYSKKEAGAYINLAETLEKNESNYQKIARYYRGAGLCYQEIHDNLIESASCFVLAGNYSEKIKEYNEAGLNFLNAGNVFKELKNFDMAYKHFIKAGDNLWLINDVTQSTESYLNAYDIAAEGKLEFNRFGMFNQIVRGLSMIASEGLKDKQFYTAATLILESIKFYEQLDTVNDVLLREMVRNLYRYYYQAANMKKLNRSQVVLSYVLAALSCILIGKTDQALEIMTEIDSEGNTVKLYKEMIEMVVLWYAEKKPIDLEHFPYTIKRLIEGSEEIMYLLDLFKRLQV